VKPSAHPHAAFGGEFKGADDRSCHKAVVSDGSFVSSLALPRPYTLGGRRLLLQA